MIIIEYTPSGQSISDFAVDEFVNQLTPGHWTVSTENVLFEVRVRVKEGRLSNAALAWNGHLLIPDANGKVKYPADFPDFDTPRMLKLL